MKIELSLRQIELLEGVLFDEIIRSRNKQRKATVPLYKEYINEIETLKYDLWKYRSGIKKMVHGAHTKP